MEINLYAQIYIFWASSHKLSVDECILRNKPNHFHGLSFLENFILKPYYGYLTNGMKEKFQFYTFIGSYRFLGSIRQAIAVECERENDIVFFFGKELGTVRHSEWSAHLDVAISWIDAIFEYKCGQHKFAKSVMLSSRAVSTWNRLRVVLTSKNSLKLVGLFGVCDLGTCWPCF